MKKIKMKVVEYDIESNSLIVAFASDVAKKDIDEYPCSAYQPTMFENPNNPEQILIEIAKTGVYIAEQQDLEDNFKADKSLEEKYSQYVGQTFEYDVEYLVENSNQTVEQYFSDEENDIDEILKDIIIDDDEDTIETNLNR